MNEDNKCFKWAVYTSALFLVRMHPERITKLEKENSENLNWYDVELPMQVDKANEN
mgnify:FL=1